jgi:hypothetical protein
MLEQRVTMALEVIRTLLLADQLNDALDFQRNLVWKTKNKRDLIQTWKNKRPFGTITWCRISINDSWGILDGKQRITALIAFANGEFADHEGFFFEEWTAELQARFLTQNLCVHQLTLDQDEDRSDLIVVFEELNNAGMKVSDPELIASSNTSIVQFIKNWFMRRINDDVEADDLRRRWCDTFRSRNHYTKRLKKTALTSICAAHNLNQHGKNAELEERIRANPAALAQMWEQLDLLNDALLPASDETRKQGYGSLTAMAVSSMSRQLNAISTSFQKLKENGLSAQVTVDAGERFSETISHYLDFVDEVRNIQNIPIKYNFGYPKVGYLSVQKFAIVWAIIIEALNDQVVPAEDEEFHEQCVYLFDQANFGPLLNFYTLLAGDNDNFYWRFEGAGASSNNMNKAKLSAKIKFIHETRTIPLN